MKKTIKLNESELKKIVAESVKKVINEAHVNCGLNSHYMNLFRNRIQNAIRTNGDIRKEISQFYSDFRKDIMDKNFTLNNLAILAKDIENGTTSSTNITPGASMFPLDPSFDYKEDFYESKLNRIVSESIKKRNKTGSIQWNGSRTDAEEDGVDRYGNPMFKIKNKNGKTMRVQSFSFRPKISENTLRQIVAESVRSVLKESFIGGDNQFDDNVAQKAQCPSDVFKMNYWTGRTESKGNGELVLRCYTDNNSMATRNYPDFEKVVNDLNQYYKLHGSKSVAQALPDDGVSRGRLLKITKQA